jgi:quercetin dioxygenase-like cupin family protein
MSDKIYDPVVFDEAIAVALAQASGADDVAPRPEVRQRLMARLAELPAEPLPPPAGFVFRYERDADWQPHPVPGIKMKLLSHNREKGYVTLLFDVAPGTRFPAHHHTGGAEECYVVSGSLYTQGRRLTAGDFVHADAETDHDELFTEEGCRVLLVVPPEDYLPSHQG